MVFLAGRDHLLGWLPLEPGFSGDQEDMDQFVRPGGRGLEPPAARLLLLGHRRERMEALDPLFLVVIGLNPITIYVGQEIIDFEHTAKFFVGRALKIRSRLCGSSLCGERGCRKVAVLVLPAPAKSLLAGLI